MSARLLIRKALVGEIAMLTRRRLTMAPAQKVSARHVGNGMTLRPFLFVVMTPLWRAICRTAMGRASPEFVCVIVVFGVVCLVVDGDKTTQSVLLRAYYHYKREVVSCVLSLFSAATCICSVEVVDRSLLRIARIGRTTVCEHLCVWWRVHRQPCWALSATFAPWRSTHLVPQHESQVRIHMA